MLNDPVLRHILYAVLIVIASGFVGMLIKLPLNTVVKRWFAKTKTTLDDHILGVIRSRVTTLCFIAGGWIGIQEVRRGLTAEHVVHHQVLDYLTIALYFLLVIVITRMVSRIITAIVGWYTDQVSAKTKSNITPTVAPMVTKITNILLFVIACIIVLDHFGINIGSFLVSLGIGSLAVALAAQETVANMIAGLVILVDQPFRVGDRIKLESGEEGDVQQIGLRSTRILNYDNNLLVVPNGELVKNRIINFSLPDESCRVLIEIPVAFNTDIQKARSVLGLLAERDPHLLKDPAPAVYLMAINEYSLLLRLSARTHDFDKKFDIETDLRERVWDTFKKEGIEVPVPQRKVYFKNEP